MRNSKPSLAFIAIQKKGGKRERSERRKKVIKERDVEGQ